MHYLAAAAALPIDINTGIQDGHNGRAVPIDHSLRAFNVLAQANGHPEQVLPADQIEEMTATARVPAALVWRGAALPDRRYPTLFHRTAGAVRVTLFDGGHVWDEGRNGDAAPALGWLAAWPGVLWPGRRGAYLDRRVHADRIHGSQRVPRWRDEAGP